MSINNYICTINNVPKISDNGEMSIFFITSALSESNTNMLEPLVVVAKTTLSRGNNLSGSLPVTSRNLEPYIIILHVHTNIIYNTLHTITNTCTYYIYIIHIHVHTNIIYNTCTYYIYIIHIPVHTNIIYNTCTCTCTCTYYYIHIHVLYTDTCTY